MSKTRVSVALVTVFLIAAVVAVALASAAEPAASPAAPSASQAEIVAIASMDTFVYEGQSTTNFGGDPTLQVGRFGGQRIAYNARILVRFNISQLPEGAEIIGATLELYQTGAEGPKEYRVRPDAIFAGWDENKATWANQPAAANMGDAWLSIGTTDGWKIWDVTKIVTNWVAGEISNYGIMLLGDGDTLAQHIFHSRTGNAALAPRLRIRYTVPVCRGVKTIYAIEDTWTDSSSPGTTHGSDDTLHLGRREDDSRRALLRFPVELYIPDNTLIYSARMEIDVVNVSGAPAPWLTSLFNLNAVFIEPVTNWANQPPPTVYYGNTAQNSNTVHKWDATAIVQDWLLGTYPNRGLVLTPRLPVEFDIVYHSRETLVAGAEKPRLIVDCGTAPPTATPTRTPLPTRTPTPTATPGNTPTPVPPVFAAPYIPFEPVLVAPPVILTKDLSIHGIEITQGIQCFDTSNGLAGCPDNSREVVTKKDTTARIYLKISNSVLSSMAGVPVRLYIRANGVWYTANVTGRAKPNIDQASGDSADVYFNVNFTNNVLVDFYAVVDPDNTIVETNEGNNRFPSSGFITLNFRKRDNLKIVGQRLRYHPAGYSGAQYAGGWAVNGGAADWFEQLLPIRNNGINYSVKSGYLNWTTSLGSGSGQHALIQTLNSQWILENLLSWLFGTGAFTGADHVYGWAPNDGYSGGHADMPVYPHAGGLGVVAIGTDRPGTSTDNPGGGALIFGHELIHDYNVFHTNTGGDDCGSNDSNSDFPYATSSIQEFGFNPATGKIYDPATTHDVMSYCPAGGSKQGWLSPFTWRKMFNSFATSVFNATVAPGERPVAVYYPTAAEESLAVNLTVYNPETHGKVDGELGQLYRVEGGLAYNLPQGDYAVELRNGEQVLSQETFVVNFESEYDAHTGENHDDPPFPPEPTDQVGLSFIISWDPAATSVALVHNGQVLDERSVSQTAPYVLITNPNGATDWPAGTTQSLTWDGTDLDGDPLTYSVMYSYGGGEEWQLIADGLTSTSYEVDVDAMAGGDDVRFRVVATDGVNVGWDEAEGPISIPDKSPIAIITNPLSGKVVVPGGLLVLLGTGNDMEDGTLPDEALRWSSDRQGELGFGPSLPLTTLEYGGHIITLTATDSLGQADSASVQVIVVYQVYAPLITKR